MLGAHWEAEPCLIGGVCHGWEAGKVSPVLDTCTLIDLMLNHLKPETIKYNFVSEGGSKRAVGQCLGHPGWQSRSV